MKPAHWQLIYTHPTKPHGSEMYLRRAAAKHARAALMRQGYSVTVQPRFTK